MFHVLCHDHRLVLAAEFSKISEVGGILEAEHSDGSPGFALKSKIRLDILNPETGECAQVPVRLAKASRKGRRWTFLVRWDRVPEILRSAL
jgi:hypothetical protein